MKTYLILAFALLVVCSGMATAQLSETQFANGTHRGTPDGITPAEETVCDGLTGAAHGLCTAYCGAMDCDSGSPQASQTACNSVSSELQQITGGAPPCLCPCVGRIENWIEALNGDFGLTVCAGYTIPGVDEFVAVQTASSDPALEFAGSEAAYYLNIGACGFLTGDFLLITPQEAARCNALVRQKAAEAGLTCPPAP